MPFAFARRAVLAIVTSVTLAAAPALAQDDAPVVAAASDLQFAVKEIAEAFKTETGKEVKLAFGSTGNFARQIREGAPFQMFMAADEKFVKQLAADGFTRDEGALYAEGRVVVMVPHGSALKPDEAMDNLAAMLDAGTITRFAIANP
ncbi:molybdate ABC transporter substrate-binding protein, partial [Rhizorhabdus sp.]|uniref:molybdate ABC transporter substrate-binding protein n=1 Tax=Rhizorhabdus sp. TaxID=1968843 RepID=UPI0019A99DF4